ncbi:MAG TPA: hypothetical protein VFP44_16050 [Usitatibacter sp.]|nr:hypothetical protein [Usitatibacter sp.]
MNATARKAAVAFVLLCAFAALSWAIFRGYMTPEMMLYQIESGMAAFKAFCS